ncbi:rRNA maturation RNase YbeY [Tautonia marina]|uniref:rRNA maturation RNase YbeY n=1 Tax=Tautonia marina TaxID=2653855 RepID=UPI001260F23C|nr:rRNA maturation RNase YbeY [Tautonia marina]
MTASPDDLDRPTLEIDLSDTQRHLRLDPDRVRSLARRTLELEGVDQGCLSIAVVDNQTIHEVNRRHLDHDWPTDVVSFLLSEPETPEFSGDLVISAEMAVSVASQCGLDPNAEFALYLVHGLLHLCGYDDLSEQERIRMRRREDEILEVLGIARPPRDLEGSEFKASAQEAGS